MDTMKLNELVGKSLFINGKLAGTIVRITDYTKCKLGRFYGVSYKHWWLPWSEEPLFEEDDFFNILCKGQTLERPDYNDTFRIG